MPRLRFCLGSHPLTPKLGLHLRHSAMPGESGVRGATVSSNPPMQSVFCLQASKQCILPCARARLHRDCGCPPTGLLARGADRPCHASHCPHPLHVSVDSTVYARGVCKRISPRAAHKDSILAVAVAVGARAGAARDVVGGLGVARLLEEVGELA